MRSINLRAKFLIGTIGLVMLLGLAVVIFVRTTLTQNLLSALQDKGIFITKHMTDMSVNHVLTEDSLALQMLINDYKSSEEDVEYIFILDSQGEVLAHTFEEGFPIDLKEANIVNSGQTYSIQSLVTEKGAILDIAAPLLKGEAGVVHVGISEEPIRKSIANTIGLIVGIIIAILVIGSGGAIALATVITKPIFELAKAAKAVGSGDLEHRVHVRTKDEIGQLGVAFNKMIAERKRSEEALREKQKQLDELMSNVNVIILEGDPFRITFVGGQVEQVLGYSSEQWLADPDFWVKHLHPDDRDRAARYCEIAIREGRDHSLEYQMISADGREVWFHDTVTVEVQEGVPVRARSVMVDITERKRAEEEKEKIQSQLLQAQKMEAIGTLAGGVAHDFNNLLTVIQGYSELSMMEVDKANPLYRDLETIHSTAVSAAGLTRQLLLFSRRQSMAFALMDINRTVDNLLKMLKRLISEDIVIKTDSEPDLWRVMGDEGNIEQVLMNLTVNARDAMPEGGKLTIKTENVTLDEEQCKNIPEAREGKFVCLSVADTGIGMDKEIVGHIFEPFFTTKEAGQGTGLGLSVVYGIVKQHEGWINVYSEPDLGSTFKVYLPAFFAKMEDETEETISLHELQGTGERILVVEDEEDVCEFTTKVLSENGYVVFRAANAEEAMDIFEREERKFHLVLSDVVLPDKSGLELVDQLLYLNPELLVLLSSGYIDEKSQWPIIREKGFRFLQKPYALPDLLRAIREAIESS